MLTTPGGLAGSCKASSGTGKHKLSDRDQPRRRPTRPLISEDSTVSALDNMYCPADDNFLYFFKGAPAARHGRYGRSRGSCRAPGG